MKNPLLRKEAFLLRVPHAGQKGSNMNFSLIECITVFLEKKKHFFLKGSLVTPDTSLFISSI